MKIFGPLYERAMKWAAHERAPTYLTVLSFFEAIKIARNRSFSPTWDLRILTCWSRL